MCPFLFNYYCNLLYIIGIINGLLSSIPHFRRAQCSLLQSPNGHQVIDLSTRGAGTSWYLPPDSRWELADGGPEMPMRTAVDHDQVGLG